ncbi:MAG: hypothetical protein AAB227_12030 [Pseudomonadota bacterium]
MSGSGKITSGTIERLQATIRRRLADFLELGPQSESAAFTPNAVERRIDELRSRLGAALAARRRIESRQRGAAAGDLAAKAEFAIAQGRDDLARAAVQRRLESEREVQDLKRDLAAIDAEAAGLEALLLSNTDSADRRRLAAKLAELDALIADAAGAPPAKE